MGSGRQDVPGYVTHGPGALYIILELDWYLRSILVVLGLSNIVYIQPCQYVGNYNKIDIFAGSRSRCDSLLGVRYCKAAIHHVTFPYPRSGRRAA